MTSAAFLANLSLALPLQSAKQCLRWWHKPSVLTRCVINTHKTYWNQVAFWIITWRWSNWAIMSLLVHKTRGIFLQECSSPWMQTSCHILREKTGLWDNWSFRQSIVEIARGRSSRLLRFCFMYRKTGDGRKPRARRWCQDWESIGTSRWSWCGCRKWFDEGGSASSRFFWTTSPADIQTKPKSIDDIRARLAGVGISIDWEMWPDAPEQLCAHVPGGPGRVSVWHVALAVS